MLWAILVAFILLWLLGFSLQIGGGLVHPLLVVALVVLIVNLVTRRRRVAESRVFTPSPGFISGNYEPGRGQLGQYQVTDLTLDDATGHKCALRRYCES